MILDDDGNEKPLSYPRMMSAKETAALCEVQIREVVLWARRGELGLPVCVVVKGFKRLYLPEDAVRDFLARRGLPYPRDLGYWTLSEAAKHHGGEWPALLSLPLARNT